MDAQRFDLFARAFAARLPRRRAIGTLSALTTSLRFGTLLPPPDESAAKGRGKGGGKKKGKKKGRKKGHDQIDDLPPLPPNPCAAGQWPCKGLCLPTCRSDQTQDYEACACACPPGEEECIVGCVTACPPGQVMDQQTCTCECLAQGRSTQDAPVCCPPGEFACPNGGCCRTGTHCCPTGGCCNDGDTCCFRQSSQSLFCCPPGAQCMQTGIPCCSNC